ncbi:MAG TPA: class I tRNA ligase family protein, partial [Bacteroidia bacterium]|nr:class I tRNA ligase family protein [Bacteroidia bacterium]
TIGTSEIQYYSADIVETLSEEGKSNFSLINIPIQLVQESILNIDSLISTWQKDRHGVFICKEGFYYKGKWYSYDQKEIGPQQFKTVKVVEKMSKSKLNVVNPDDIISKYGADTFRMYEMFLGPVEQSKPWDTKGIEGVHRFLRKLWRMFFDELKGKIWNNDKATEAELKILHKTIKKIEEDTERFSFNTAVSTFMICVNELSDIKSYKKEILESILILLTPYAPHISEELWHQLGNSGSVLDAKYPVFNPQYLIESSKEYPVSVNGKHRTNINIAMDASSEEVEKIVLANDVIQKWTEGKPPKKVIFVKGKMVNVVV